MWLFMRFFGESFQASQLHQAFSSLGLFLRELLVLRVLFTPTLGIDSNANTDKMKDERLMENP